MTFAVFGQTLTHGFVDYDDLEYVVENPMVNQGLSLRGIAWAFTHLYAANWHPLTWISHMLDCQLYGLHAGGHHLTNVALHTAAVIALFLVLREMTGALWRSAFVAAVFAIHPLRVESVAWVAERKDVLSGFFFMLTVGAYVRYARRPWSPWRYGLVVLFFAAGLMSKPMLVTLPVVLLLLDYWPLQRKETRRRLVMEKLPLLAMSAAVCVATLFAQSKAISSDGSFSVPYRLGNALTACAIYLGQMVWPLDLSVLYPFPHHGQPPWEVALSAVLLAGFFAITIWQRRKQPWLLAGWLWYLVMLLPVLGIIQVGVQAHADRYTYLPQIGIYVALTWLVAEWGIGRMALGILMAGVLAVLMACAWQQAATWQNNETLWTYALACDPNNDFAEDNVGMVMMHTGRLDAAIACFQQELQIMPDSPLAHNNLANALLKAGDVDDAIMHGQRAVELIPQDAEACGNLGNALFRKGKVDEAVADFHKALQLKPASAMAHNNLGAIFLQRGALDEAMAEFQKALQLKPLLAEAHYNFAKALVQKGSPDKALPHFEQAVKIDPADPRYLNDLAWLLATSSQASLRQGSKADQLARIANNLAGGKSPDFLATLAASCAEAGQFDDARRHAKEAIAIAQMAGETNLIQRISGELRLYEAGRPFHQP